MNWYKLVKEAGKEELLLKQKPKNYSFEDWSKAVSWAVSLSSKYAVWLTNLLRKNPQEFRFGEDDKDVLKTLEVFERAKKRKEFPNKNINEFNSYADLVSAIEPYVEVSVSNNKVDLSLISSNGSYSLYDLDTFDAAYEVAKNTQWCIKNEDTYNMYKLRGPIFYVDKNKSPYALYHFATGQFKDPLDKPMSVGKIIPIIELLESNKQELEVGELLSREDKDYDSDIDNEENVSNDIMMIEKANKKFKELILGYSNSEEVPEEHTLLNVLIESLNFEEFSLAKNIRIIEDIEALIAISQIIPVKPKLIDDTIKNYYKRSYEQVDKKIEAIYLIEYHLKDNDIIYESNTKYNLVINWMKEIPSEFSKYADFEKMKHDFVKKIALNVNSMISAKYYDSKKTNDHSSLSSYDVNIFVNFYNKIKDAVKFSKDSEIISIFKKSMDMLSEILSLDIEEEIGSEKPLDRKKILSLSSATPKELMTDVIVENSKKVWMKLIEEDPSVFNNGTRGLYDNIKMSNEMKKELEPFIEPIVNEKINSTNESVNLNIKNKDDSRNIRSTQYDKSGIYSEAIKCIGSIPDFMSNQPNAQNLILMLLEESPEIYSFRPVTLLSSLRPNSMTPKVVESIMSYINRNFTNIKSAYENANIPKFIKDMPIFLNQLKNYYINEEDIYRFAFLKDGSGISVSIPKSIREDAKFQKAIADRMIEELKTGNPKIFSRYIVQNSIPDFVKNDSRYKKAFRTGRAVFLANNPDALVKFKTKPKDNVRTIQREINSLEEKIKQNPDPNDIKSLNNLKHLLKHNVEEYEPYENNESINNAWKNIYEPIRQMLLSENSIFVNNDFTYESNHILKTIIGILNNPSDFPEENKHIYNLYENQKDAINPLNYTTIHNYYFSCSNNMIKEDLHMKAQMFINNVVESRLNGIRNILEQIKSMYSEYKIPSTIPFSEKHQKQQKLLEIKKNIDQASFARKEKDIDIVSIFSKSLYINNLRYQSPYAPLQSYLYNKINDYFLNIGMDIKKLEYYEKTTISSMIINYIMK